MHWLALLPAPCTDENAPTDLQSTAWLALQFSPRVARLEEAVVLEAEASLRLFGGADALLERLDSSAAQAGIKLTHSPWAGSSLAALALLRAGSSELDLDSLPLTALTAVSEHRPMLERLGCRRLADVRRLPRAALAKRFGQALLRALDQAYGAAPEVHEWLVLPERFEARLELPFRVEQAEALHHHALGLLRQLCAWLAARHAGVQGFTLSWKYDAMRPRDSASGGELNLHTAQATRDFSHLSRLLGEHLTLTALQAPAGELGLRASSVIALQEHSESLILDTASGKPREALPLLLERLSVRLGAERVRCSRLSEDHRLDIMQTWQAWPITGKVQGTRPPPGPQPSWLLDPPLSLSAHNDQPLHHGPLLRIAGPHRVETGWWNGHQARDYYLFFGPKCGLLWVYHERLNTDEAGWFLHGVFA